MKRREFIGLIGGAAVWPSFAHAQSAMPVIGFLNGQSAAGYAHLMPEFHRGLREFGFTEGQNVAVEYRWADGQYDRLLAMATDLLSRRVSVLVATGGGSATIKGITTVPIVAISGGDPVKEGYVASLNRPGANITAVALFAYSLGLKRLEVLRELVPTAKIIAVLANPNNPSLEGHAATKEVEAAARAAGQDIRVLNASSERDFEPAFAAMMQQGAGALLVMADPYFNSRRERLIALAARHSIPAIYEWRDFVAEGGLISYGSSLADAIRQLGLYTGKVLKGVKPADLPVMQAVKVEMVINLKTAKALGLTVPQTLFARADEVIE